MITNYEALHCLKILFVSTLGNEERTVWRKCVLMLKYKRLMAGLIPLHLINECWMFYNQSTSAQPSYSQETKWEFISIRKKTTARHLDSRPNSQS